MNSAVASGNARNKTRKGILPLLLLGALLLRLLFLPFAQMAHGDAVSRIFIAWQGLSNPISYLKTNWGPLHFFLIAAALRVWPNTIYSPMLLHILFSVATAVPLYAFVKREWNETAALYVAAASLLYPVAFRQGYLALTEVPFVFFVMCCMNALSSLKANPKTSTAISSGILLTLACALRMEGWILIPVFALLLRKNWKTALYFVCFASIFPIVSIVLNYLYTGDPLPGLTAARVWQVDVGGVNENLTSAEIFRRLIYFPSVLFFGLTPPVCVVCLAGAILAIKHRKPQAEWLFPPVALLCIFLRQAAKGYLLLEIRYVLILGYMILPFASEVVERFRNTRWFALTAFLILASMIPLSYSRVVFARVMGTSFANPFPPDLEIVPKVLKRAVHIAQLLPAQPSEQAGLILDFFNWKDTSYVALMSQMPRERIWIMPGNAHETFAAARFSNFIAQHPSGVLIVAANSRFIRLEADSTASFQSIDQRVKLKPLHTVEDLKMFSYSTNPLK